MYLALLNGLNGATLRLGGFTTRWAAIAALGHGRTGPTTVMSEQTGPKKQLARRRRANAPGGRPHQHMVRVTVEEEARLRLLAEGQAVTIPRLLVEAALAGGGETPTQRREAMTELFRIRRQLAGLTTNVNQIARAVNTDGRMPVGSAAALARIEDVVEKIDAAIDGLAAR